MSFWFVVVVSAQGNDLAAPAGGRATLMGNTGVALGRDGSAPFYNPATIVRIRDERLAFSVNFYSLTLTDLPDWHQPRRLDSERFGDVSLPHRDLVDLNFRPLPSTLCLFFTLEDLTELALNAVGAGDAGERDTRAQRPTGKKLAVCFATLESEDFDVQAIRFRTTTPAGASSHVQSLTRRWSRTYLGPTYSVSLSSRLAVGGSLQVVYSHDSFGIHSESVSAQLDGTGLGSSLSSAGSGRSFELTGTLGATYRIGRVTLGASLRLPSLHVYGDYEATFAQSYSSSDQDMAQLIEGSGSMSAAPPTRLALGIGVALDRWTFELDGALSVPLQRQLYADLNLSTSTLASSGVDRAQSSERYQVRGQPVFNPSFGMEYFFTAGLSLLAGVSANFSSIERLDPVRSVGNLVHARTSHVSASLGLGSYWSGGELLFGLQLDYGWGRALGVNPFTIPNDWSVIDVRAYTLLFVISGSTNLNSIVRALNTIANGGKPADGDQPAQSRQAVPARLAAPDQQPKAAEQAPVTEPGAPSRLPANPDAREAQGISAEPGAPAASQPDEAASRASDGASGRGSEGGPERGADTDAGPAYDAGSAAAPARPAKPTAQDASAP